MFAHKTSWSYSRYPAQTNELNNKGTEKVSLSGGGEKNTQNSFDVHVDVARNIHSKHVFSVQFVTSGL